HGDNLHEALSRVFENEPHLREIFDYPDSALGRLFAADYDHEGNQMCEKCYERRIIRRPHRQDYLDPWIHFGNIAWVNTDMKHGVTRDPVAKSENVICFEMEASGLMDAFP